MGSQTVPILLVTANVGSIFEDPLEMLKIWTDEFLSTVSRLNPKFIALHCQEVGGKNYELSMNQVEHFVKLLMSSNELRLFDRVRVYLDEDYSSAEHFTALGNLYFVHSSLNDIQIWDFNESQFCMVKDKEIHSGNIEAVTTKEKAKFPQDFFPECKWSRKGFMRTRWSLNGTILDLVNIHLFHDASNFIAMEPYPSVYCKNRRRALQHTLQKFHNDSYPNAPYFLFGDFNFRTDTEAVVKKLTNGMKSSRPLNSGGTDYSKLHFMDDDSKLVLTIGKKIFKLLDHQTVFLDRTSEWLKSFDKELEAFSDTLVEYPVTFPPSYPFEESTSGATTYMQTRCPAWCDRVVMSKNAKKLIDDTRPVEYGLMGVGTCMGDHKPVYLRADLISDSGTIHCCDHAPFACLPEKCQCCQLFAYIKINIIDVDPANDAHANFVNVPIDSTLLHEPLTREMLSHEPYTPDSTDSRSPLEKILEESGSDLRKDSVSPDLLKKRLQSIQFELSMTPRLMKRSASENVDIIKKKDIFFRSRAMSEVPKVKLTKAKLISTISAGSLHRLQSHHSSSDEDWFEFETEFPTKLKDCADCSNDEIKIDSVSKNVPILDDSTKSTKILCWRSKKHTNRDCCVVA